MIFTSTPLCSFISRLAACNPSNPLAQMATLAPSNVNRTAVARPMPLLPPVINATLPVNPKSISQFLLLHTWLIMALIEMDDDHPLDHTCLPSHQCAEQSESEANTNDRMIY